MDKNIKISSQSKIGKNSEIGEWVSIGMESGKSRSKKNIIGINSLIRSHTVIYSGNTIGNNFHASHGVLIRELNNIGNNVSIGSHSVIEHHIKIGNNVRIHSGAFICEYSYLADDCWIGPHVTLTNAKFPRSKLSKKVLKGPIIKKGAIIGANCTILPGIKIGIKALIGAGSVVTKDIPDFAVAVGNPAKVINHIYNLPYDKDTFS